MNPSDIQRVFQALPGLYLILRPDPAFTIAGASRAYLDATHADASIVGRPLFDAFPGNPNAEDPSGPAALRASLERVLASRTTDAMDEQRYDIVLPAEAGGGYEERYWQPVNVPVLTERGEVDYIVHQVEDAAAAATRDAFQILESIGEGFFTLDRQWRFDYVNREAHRILGIEPGSLVGRVFWDAYPGLEGTEFERSYRRTMVLREKASFTALYPPRGCWYEVATFPAPQGVSVYFRDVTEHKRIEAEREQLVAQSERQRRIFETALDSTPDFFYVIDLQHRALYANQALIKTWGVGDVRGKNWLELGYESWQADLHDGEIDRVIATGAPVRGEIPFTGTNGRRIYDYIFAPVLGPRGEVVAVAGTARDVTDRQAAEQAVREQALRLAESDRAKDEFLATLSHELRNPLAPLRNSIELLLRDDTAARQAPVLAMMARQVNHLVRLVDDLLEMSRISRGALSLRCERVGLAAVVRNAVETSESLLQAAGHTFTLDLPPDPVWLEGDPVRLAQVLAHLLNNAARYTEDGGRIALRAWREGGQAVIRVSDNGIGIATEALPRTFEMFSRGDRHSARNQGGLGIGLALSRRLIALHDGTLEAYSGGIGQGSDFTVRLPLAPAAGPASPEPVPTAAPQSLARTRALVVDDNRDAGDSLGFILEELGAQVRVARSGAEALQAFAAWRPTVVLLDIGMPGMDGYEVARTLRSRYPDGAGTLVALTGWGHDADRKRTREAGFDHHLVKPADLPALQQLLASLEMTAA